MTADLIAGIAGVVLSLLFSYVPGFAAWYGVKPEDTKRLLMLGFLALVAAGTFGLACSGLAGEVGLAVTCDKPGAIALVKAFFVAVIANQATYQITPSSKSRAAGRGLR